MDEHDGWDEKAYQFKLRCDGFFDLCGGLLKLYNICGPNTDMVKANASLAIETFQKICEDFIGNTGKGE